MIPSVLPAPTSAPNAAREHAPAGGRDDFDHAIASAIGDAQRHTPVRRDDDTQNRAANDRAANDRAADDQRAGERVADDRVEERRHVADDELDRLDESPDETLADTGANAGPGPATPEAVGHGARTPGDPEPVATASDEEATTTDRTAATARGTERAQEVVPTGAPGRAVVTGEAHDARAAAQPSTSQATSDDDARATIPPAATTGATPPATPATPATTVAASGRAAAQAVANADAHAAVGGSPAPGLATAGASTGADATVSTAAATDSGATETPLPEAPATEAVRTERADRDGGTTSVTADDEAMADADVDTSALEADPDTADDDSKQRGGRADARRNGAVGQPGQANAARSDTRPTTSPSTGPAIDAPASRPTTGPETSNGSTITEVAAAPAPDTGATPPPVAPSTPAAPAAPVAATTPSPPPQAPAPPVLDQLVGRVLPLVAGPDGTHDLQLELRPAELGLVRLAVTLDDGTIHVRVHAEDPASRRLLLESLPDLRAALEEAGIRAGDLDVRSDSGDRADETAQRDARRRARGHDTSATVRSEVAAATSRRPSGDSNAAVDLLL